MGTLYKRGKTWWCDYYDRVGVRVRKSTKMRDKQLAQKVLDSFEIDEKLAERGAKIPTRVKASLEPTLKLYESAMRTAGKSVGHVDRTGQLIRSLATFNGWSLLNDISADGVNSYAGQLSKLGQSARTIGSMITAVRSFCRWCARNGKLFADPTITVEKPSVANDRRIERRMLTAEEWQWLKKHLEETDVELNGQSPAERLLMYRVAIETGLRSGELRSLIRSSLHLAGDEPHIIVKASLTKNAKQAKQYLSDALAADLSKRVASRMASAKVFNVSSRTDMAKTLRKDVKAARLLWLDSLDEAGRRKSNSDFLKSPNSQKEVLDFHALRHTCGAWLVMQGVTLAEVREIMRHSTITLTIDCYGHLAPDARSRSRHVLGGLL